MLITAAPGTRKQVTGGVRLGWLSQWPQSVQLTDHGQASTSLGWHWRLEVWDQAQAGLVSGEGGALPGSRAFPSVPSSGVGVGALGAPGGSTLRT